jgi:hypothetical protein
VKFGFIAKHREIWPADWLYGALDVSPGGFYAWLTRPRGRRDRIDEETSEQFQKLMAGHGVVCSMSHAGNVWEGIFGDMSFRL